MKVTKDAKFLACARVTQADIFISGDKDFSEAQKLLTDSCDSHIKVSMFL
jgi:hypothetical protein